MTALTDPAVLAFITRYGPDEKLALIPWDDLPADLARACERFVAEWWTSLDPDVPIQASGLSSMTVAQLLEVWSAQRDDSDGLQWRYRVVSYLRIEPEESVPTCLAEALSELDQLQLLAPESIHRVEEVCQVIVASDEALPQG